MHYNSLLLVIGITTFHQILTTSIWITQDIYTGIKQVSKGCYVIKYLNLKTAPSVPSCNKVLL